MWFRLFWVFFLLGNMFSSVCAQDSEAQSPKLTLSDTGADPRPVYQEKVVDYARHWPTLTELEQDWPRIRQLLSASALRIQLNVANLPDVTHIEALQNWLRARDFKLELRLEEISGHETELFDGLQNLRDQGVFPFVIVNLKDIQNLKDFYVQLCQAYPAEHLGLLSRHAEQLQLAVKLDPQARLLLYDYYGPIQGLQQTLARLDRHMGQQPWQLARFVMPEMPTEYQQAWWYRFAFFFSKQRGLAPAVVPFPDQREAEGIVPGLLRPDGSFRPQFWLSQIYFHVDRIDLDEHKLMAALYETVPENYQKKHFKKPEAMLEHFLMGHYKVRPEINPLAYIESKNSAIYYDFLQQRVEESLLNSHFSMFKNIKMTPLKQTEQGQRYQVDADFLSALGRFRFSQFLTVSQGEQGFFISELGRPELQNPISTLQVSPVQNEASGLTAYQDPQKQAWLGYQLEQSASEPQMLQPLYHEAQDTGHITIPHRLDFLFYKNIQAGALGQGLIAAQAAQQVKYQYNKPPHIRPRQFEAILNTQQDRLSLTLTNPLVERLLLPAARFSLQVGSQRFDFRTVLPQALLPLERREYTLPWPQGKPNEAIQIHYVEAQGFPIINLEINQDDAFRSKILERPVQALIKYREVLKRFGPAISQQRRWQLIHEIALLAGAHEPQRALPELQGHVKQWLKGEAPDWYLYHALAETLLKAGAQASAQEAVQMALQAAPQELKIWLLSAYIYQLQGDWRSTSQVLAQALERFPDEVLILEPLSQAYEQGGQYLSAAQTLARLLKLQPSIPGFERLAYLYERAGYWSDALAAYQQLLQRDPGRIQAYLKIARLYQKTQRLSQALDYYLRYLKLCPRCQPQIYADVAHVYKTLGQNTAAMDYYAQHIAYTNAYQSRQILADLQDAAGLTQQALGTLWPLYQACARRCGQTAVKVAYYQQQLGHWEQALEAYQRAYQFSQNPQDLATVAYTALEAQQPELAQRYFEKALKLARGQHSRQAWEASLAYLYLQNEQGEKALSLLKRHWQAQRSEAVLANLLTAFLQADRARAGRDFLKTITLPVLKQASSHYLIGKIYQQAEDWEQAIAPLQVAICTSEQPETEYYRLLAAVYRSLGRDTQAIEWLKELDAYYSGDKNPEGPSRALCPLLN